MQRYVIVGGGLAGLTAANALAGTGEVILLEQAEHLGGRAGTRRDRGYLLNFGPHALYRGGIAMKTLRGWEVAFSGNPPQTNTAALMMHAGRMYPLIGTTRGLLTTQLFGASEKLQALRLFAGLTAGKATNAESMRDWLERHARSQRVREFGAMLVRVSTYTAAQDLLSARAALEQFRSALSHGVLYLDGGWQTLVDGLSKRAKARGVTIRTGAAAHSLKEIDADAVILAMPPQAVEQISGRTLPEMHPVRVACLDLGLRAMPKGAANVAFGIDQPLYLSAHSAVAALAPEGAALVHVAKYLSDKSDPAQDRAQMEQFADQAMPGWREQVEIERFLPNMTVTGTVYSPHGRPAADVLGIPRVALAGDWVGDEGMLADAAVASGLHAARVVQRQKVRAA